MIVKRIGIIFLSIGLVLVSAPKVFADQQAEIILKALINKGIITQSDIDSAAQEVKTDKKAEVPEGVEERVTALEKNAKDTPRWVKNTEFSGDLRLRYEMIEKPGPGGENDNRTRVRFRYGAKTKVNDQLKIGFGLATGSSDAPTSTNQTLEQEFQSKAIWLNYAYAQYEPTKWLTFLGGKFESPFFHTDMLWDSDIRFDGFAVKSKKTVFKGTKLPETELFLVSGYFPLDNNTAGASDLALSVFQLGEEMKIGETAKLKSGLAYYNFHNMEGYVTSKLEEKKSTNTSTTVGVARILEDFNVLSPTVELTFNDPLGVGVPITLIGEYADNLAVTNDKKNDAWRAGVQFGKKVKKKGDWLVLGQYSRLENDSFVDIFPDADLNSGGTNARGWEFIIDYGLIDNVALGLDYYNSRVINGAKANDQILEADIVIKF